MLILCSVLCDNVTTCKPHNDFVKHLQLFLSMVPVGKVSVWLVDPEVWLVQVKEIIPREILHIPKDISTFLRIFPHINICTIQHCNTSIKVERDERS